MFNIRDQAEKLRQMVQSTHIAQPSPIIKRHETKARVIAVTSGKGGVGKTNFTVNLALSLADFDKKVLIIDADLGLANVEVVLGCSVEYSLLNLLEERVPISSVAVEGPKGIKFMSGGSGIHQLANLSEEQLIHITSKISLFDNWADIILIDTGAGLSKNVLNFVMAADEVIIITTPEPTAIADAYAMMKAYAAHQGTAPIKLVVNRVLEIDEGQSVVDKLNKVAFRFLGLPINSLGFVYEDRNLVKAVKKQTPVLLSYPDTISTRCIENIAYRLLYGDNIPYPKGIKGFISKFWEMVR